MSVDPKTKSSRLAKLNRLLPLVAIGTVADCQSIIEPTNRMLVKADRKSTRLNSSHVSQSRMPSSA